MTTPAPFHHSETRCCFPAGEGGDLFQVCKSKEMRCGRRVGWSLLRELSGAGKKTKTVYDQEFRFKSGFQEPFLKKCLSLSPHISLIFNSLLFLLYCLGPSCGFSIFSQPLHPTPLPGVLVFSLGFSPQIPHDRRRSFTWMSRKQLQMKTSQTKLALS